MYDHIGLKVSDLARSVRFYKAALGALGYELCSQDEAGASFGPAKAPALWLSVAKGSTGAGVHVAFRAADHAAIKRFHQQGLKAGGRDHGSAGPARRLQPDLLRRLPARSRRQQRRSRVHALAATAREPSGHVWCCSILQPRPELRRMAGGIAGGRVVRQADRGGSAQLQQLHNDEERWTWHPFARKCWSRRRPERIWEAVRDVGAVHTRLAAGLRGRLPARRRRPHRHLRQRPGGARADRRRRRCGAPPGVVRRAGTTDAPQRVAAGVRRGRRAQPGRVDRRRAAARPRRPHRRHDGPRHARHAADAGGRTVRERRHDRHDVRPPFLACLHANGPPPIAPATWTSTGGWSGSWDLDVTRFLPDGTTRRRPASGTSGGCWRAAPSRTSGSCRHAGPSAPAMPPPTSRLWHDAAGLRSAGSMPGRSSGPIR